MNGVKGILQSKGVWGGILATVGTIAGYLFHVSVTDVDVQQVTDAVSQIVTAAGGILAVWGRIAATKVIGKAS